MMHSNTMLAKLVILIALQLTLGVVDIEGQNTVALSNIEGYDISNNITSRTDDYAMESERNMRAIIKLSSDELEAYRVTYAKQLDVISTQKSLLETNLMNIQQHLITLELLNDLSKYCVQKYRLGLTAVTTVISRITSCTTSAQSSYASMMSAPTTTIANMNSYMNTNFKTLKDNCVKLHSKAPLNYTLCITQAVSTAEAAMNSYRRTFNTQMQASTCSGDGRIEKAVDCSFLQVYTSTYQYGGIMNYINNCVDGKEYCPKCYTTEKTESCGNLLYMHDTADLFTNTTITNPFRGWHIDSKSTNPTNSTKCVEVIFTTVPA